MIRGLSGPPRAPTKIGPSGGKRMRAHRDIVLNQRQHVLQHRHHAGLVALAGDDQHVACAGHRHVAAFQAERFGDAQARSVQQRHHGGVAGPDPGIAGLAGALAGVGKTFRRRHLDRFRQALADLGRADRRERADLAAAFPFEKASERAQPRQRPHQRPSADIAGAPHRHEGPDVAGLKACKTRKRHLRAPMFPEKNQALADVAGIGLQRLRRQPSLGAQMRQPARHFQRDVVGGAGKLDRLDGGNWLGHALSEPALGCDDSSDYIAPLSFTVR